MRARTECALSGDKVRAAAHLPNAEGIAPVQGETPSSDLRSPSVLDLGRRIASLQKVYNALDEEETRLPLLDKPDWTFDAEIRRRDLKRAKMLAGDRLQALKELALTLPARSLGDVAAHLALAWQAFDSFDNSEVSECHRAYTMRKLRRVLLGSLPVVLAAAKIDLTEIDDESTADFIAKEHPDLGEGA